MRNVNQREFQLFDRNRMEMMSRLTRRIYIKCRAIAVDHEEKLKSISERLNNNINEYVDRFPGKNLKRSMSQLSW